MSPGIIVGYEFGVISAVGFSIIAGKTRRENNSKKKSFSAPRLNDLE